MSNVPDVRRQRRWQLGGLLVMVALVAALAIAVGGTHSTPVLRPGAPVPGTATVTTLLAGVPQQGPVLGAVRAPVTLVEFGDLQCPVCGQFARDALPTLVRREVRSGRLQVAFRPLAFIGSDSARGARMALAAGQQNRLWQFIELFYDNQRDENSGYVSDDFLTALGAATSGLNTALALRQRDSAAVSAALASAMAQANARHVRATPAFLLGHTGAALRPFSPVELSAASFTAAIDRLAAPRIPLSGFARP